MTLAELVLFLVIGMIAFQFWRLRSFSEAVYAYLNQYCQTHQLQLLSVARKRTRISARFGKIDWLTEFEFEFSGNGEDRYTGQVEMVGKRVIRTHIPPHRV